MDEIEPNSCMVPVNRGASATDRSTWNAKVASTKNSAGTACNGVDASIEEIFHIIQKQMAKVYPT